MARWHAPVALTVALLLAAGSSAQGEKKDAERRDKEKLTGTWTVVSLEVDGKVVPAALTVDFQFIFTAESFTRKKGGKAESGAAYRLDPARTPKQMDFTDGSGKEKGKVVQGIYELDGDTLRLCFRSDYKKGDKGLDPPPRPTRFDGGAGTKQVLMVLKRERR
jgi:uncharacterized protein (TIGR03067 family)